MKSKFIGAIVIIAVIMGIVTFSYYKNAATVPGIVLRPTEAQAMGQGSPSTAPRSRPAAITTRPQAPINSPGSSGEAAQSDPSADAPEKPVTEAEVVVHVAGAVRHPGVYHLPKGARNENAVNAAGGLAANANEASLNLAAPAVDGSQLYVKNVSEQPSGGASEDTPAAKPIEVVKPGKSASSLHGRTLKANVSALAGAAKPAKLKDPSEGRININTASAEELQRISGIGPAMAEKIIEYRKENHGFQSIDDLLQISGVGPKKLAKWSPFLRLR